MVCLLAPVMAAAQFSASSTRIVDDEEASLTAANGIAGEEFMQEPPMPVDQTPPTTPVALVTVHGVVLNGASGEPLPRALVKVDSGDAIGALTDGEGRFEIAGVPAGIETFEVVKPGFGGKVAVGDYVVPDTHTVEVAAEMPELKFSLHPENALYGQVTLSTGDAGVGIGLTLLRQTIEAGHASWTEVERHQTTPEGDFRFAGLQDGTYLLMTEPAFDNERATPPACDGPVPVEMQGFPVMFYGGSADAAGAARIVLAGGQTSQANLTLSSALFHEVRATPLHVPEGEQWQFTPALLNQGGVVLEYPLRQDEKTHVVCGYLPDGSYTLMMEGTTREPLQMGMPVSRQPHRPKTVAGMIEFSMENRAETRLRLPLASGTATPIRIRYEPGPPKPVQATQGDGNEGDEPAGAIEANPQPVQLMAVPADGMTPRGVGPVSADWVDEELYELGMTAPGSYWIQGGESRPGVCMGAVTAAGQSLAHTPWTAGAGGTGSSIDVVVRTDCAKLTVKLPASGQVDAPGEDQSYYFYAVPEFDSIAEVHEGIVQRSGETSSELGDLTPGTYRVFVFDEPHSLEYRAAGALEKLAGQGQEVTLEPGGNATLVLEAPRP